MRPKTHEGSRVPTSELRACESPGIEPQCQQLTLLLQPQTSTQHLLQHQTSSYCNPEHTRTHNQNTWEYSAGNVFLKKVFLLGMVVRVFNPSTRGRGRGEGRSTGDSGWKTASPVQLLHTKTKARTTLPSIFIQCLQKP